MGTQTSGYTNWPNNTARLTQKGGIEVDSTRSYKCEDIYTFVMPWGDRPGVPGVSIENLPEIGDVLSGFPAPSSGQPDLRPLANKITFSQPDPASRVWQGTVSYATPTGSISGTGENQVKIVKIAVSNRTWTRDLVKGVYSNKWNKGNGWTTVSGAAWPNVNAVVNSCGDPFSEPIQYEMATPVIDIVRLEKKSMTSRAISFSNTINAEPITIAGIAIKQYAGKIYTSTNQVDDENFDYETTYHIELSQDYNEQIYSGWWCTTQDKGYNYKIKKNGKLSSPIQKTIIGPDGRETTPQTPIFLNGEGEENDISSSSVVYLAFCPYYATSWSTLNLPSSL